jgi:hypothetical protein
MQPINNPNANSQRNNDDIHALKSKSALSRYVFSGQGPDIIDKNSVDFDEIPSVQLRAEFNIGPLRKGGAVPDISLSNANISYTSSSANHEEEKLI